MKFSHVVLRKSGSFHKNVESFSIVPKAQPLTYTQLAFYLSDQTSTEVILDTIKVT